MPASRKQKNFILSLAAERNARRRPFRHMSRAGASREIERLLVLKALNAR